MGQPQEDIEDDYLARGTAYETLTERAFKSLYTIDEEGNNGHYKLMIHSNKVCLLALAPNHPIILKDLKIASVSFHEKCLNNKVSGKKKHGSQFLTPCSIICTIHCEDMDRPFIVRSNLIAKLIEINEGLIKNPDLLKSVERGYIAIVTPKVNEFEREIGRWTCEDAYNEIVNSKK